MAQTIRNRAHNGSFGMAGAIMACGETLAAQSGTSVPPAPATRARIARDVAIIRDVCRYRSGPHGPAPRPHKRIETAISRTEAAWLVRAAGSHRWWGRVGRSASFIGAFYDIDHARNINHLASICLYFGAGMSPWAKGNAALRWQPRVSDWALRAMSAEGYLMDLYWWRRDRIALAAAFRYMWDGGPSEGRDIDIADCWRYGRSDLLACAASDVGTAAVLADGLYTGGPNGGEPDLPSPRRTLAILRRLGRLQTPGGRGARAVAAALMHELHVYGNPV